MLQRCESCGLLVAVPHGTNQHCIEALSLEISLLRSVAARPLSSSVAALRVLCAA
jgi:hypothetical protein